MLPGDARGPANVFAVADNTSMRHISNPPQNALPCLTELVSDAIAADASEWNDHQNLVIELYLNFLRNLLSIRNDIDPHSSFTHVSSRSRSHSDPRRLGEVPVGYDAHRVLVHPLQRCITQSSSL